MPPAGAQNAAWSRYKVGSHDITVVTDGVNRCKFPDGVVANKSREEVNAGLVAAFLQPVPDMIAISFTPILINTGSKFVGMDTEGGRGQLEPGKAAAGPT